jgi:Holliday junction resolvase-like predicted endonuclease
VKHDSYIQKADGNLALFNRDKLVGSLVRSGANESMAESIADEIENDLFHGMKTQNIYRKAFKLLRGGNKAAASNYHLRKAVMDLGPSGYALEHLVADILKHKGYRVQTGVILQGRCVTHEVDVLAENETEVRFIECKFHNQPGVKSDVKIALYVHSRIQDLAQEWKRNHENDTRLLSGGLITNTKLTEDARVYASCNGFWGIGWDSPHHLGLMHQLTELKLAPITLIPSLTKREKEIIVKMGMVICRELIAQKDKLYDSELDEKRIEKLICEAKEIMTEFNFDTTK